MKTKYVGIVSLVIVAVFMMLAVAELPEFGSFQKKEIAGYYLENSLEDTGSANAVNSIVWDYRGYDTLGEETVLFCAALGVFTIIRRRFGGPHRKDDL
jgi:multisubunit Na+/H+ antiporter MnhB subunit